MLEKDINSEVLGVLIALGNEYITLIPTEIFEYLFINCNPEKVPDIDKNKSILDQNISKEARIFLTMLKLNYWCKTSEEKEELIKILNENEKKQNSSQIDYYKDIFKQNNLINNDNKNDNSNNTTTEMIEYKEKNFIQKIFEKIINFFKKK